MLLTDKVSVEWLEAHNMTNHDFEIGVPRDPISLGVTWKALFELTDDDLKAIDAYYDKVTANPLKKAS